MGKKIAIVVKIFPSDEKAVMTNLNDIKYGKIQDIKKEPFAFGINIIRAVFVAEEEDISKLEEEIKSLKGVSEITIEGITLL